MGLSQLYTGYFALVMATGIVSLALEKNRLISASRLLLGIGSISYLLLIVLYFLRAILFRRETWLDLIDASKMFGYFTFVAGSDVLAVCFLSVRADKLGFLLGIVALIAWLILIYFTMTVLVFHNERPVNDIMNGAWLLTTVSTESLSVVISSWESQHSPMEGALAVSFAFWAFGIFIYLIVIALIMYRFFFFKVHSKDLTPPTKN